MWIARGGAPARPTRRRLGSPPRGGSPFSASSPWPAWRSGRSPPPGAFPMPCRALEPPGWTVNIGQHPRAHVTTRRSPFLRRSSRSLPPSSSRTSSAPPPSGDRDLVAALRPAPGARRSPSFFAPSSSSSARPRRRPPRRDLGDLLFVLPTSSSRSPTRGARHALRAQRRRLAPRRRGSSPVKLPMLLRSVTIPPSASRSASASTSPSSPPAASRR